MHNPKAVLENEIHKLFGEFEIQMDHLITYRQPDQVIENKNKQKKTDEPWTLAFQLITGEN